jgi:hypothetical protein
MGAPSYPYGDIGADIPDLDSTPITPIPSNSAPSSRPTKVNTLSYVIFISQININLELNE